MARQSKYTREFLEPIVKESNSLREVAKKLGISTNNATNNVKPLLIRMELDYTHFNAYANKRSRYTDEQVFVENSPLARGSGSSNGKHGLRFRAKKYIPYTCALCNGEPMWHGKELLLELDHINGIHDDNRLCNLRFLCPNCHTQTPTHGYNYRKEIINETT